MLPAAKEDVSYSLSPFSAFALGIWDIRYFSIKQEVPEPDFLRPELDQKRAVSLTSAVV